MNESRSIDSEVFELPHSSFVLEPDYADIARRPQHNSQPPFFYTLCTYGFSAGVPK